MMKMMNIYIYSWGENLKEAEGGRGDGDGWVVGRYTGCNYIFSICYVISLCRMHHLVGGTYQISQDLDDHVIISKEE